MVSEVYSPAVSVIMPVYNAGNTVGRMVDSIIAQTFQDWELIAVDDGSTDGSGAILDRYAAVDSRVRVIHKPNGGVASARKVGIGMACGDYTIHADSDDWVEPTMLEDMLSVAKNREADIVISDYFADAPGTVSRYIVQNIPSCNSSDVLYALYNKGLFGGLCHKLIRRSVYGRAGADFVPEIDYCEDLLVLTRILANADPRIVHLPKAYYHYVENPGSLTQRVTRKGFDSMRRFHKEVIQYLPKEGRFANIPESFALDEFLVLFMNRLYADRCHAKREYLKVKPFAAKSRNLRWRVGFWCVENGFIRLAHRFIRF